MKLEGKTALITGGGSGIGVAIAECFVAEGAKVCISGRRQEALETVAGSLPPGRVVICPGDVSYDNDVARMVETTVEFGGRLDVLVNNAGISGGGSVTDVDRAHWRRTLDVNLTGPFMLMQEAIPHMIANGGGSIINVASLAGMRCLPGAAAYSAAKAGLIQLTKQAALDYGPYNIRCNAVCPGAVRTPMLDGELSEICGTAGCDVDAYLRKVCSALPLRRCGGTREIAEVCLFFAGDASSFITGVALLVDGGTAIVDAYGASLRATARRAAEAQDAS